MGFKSDPSKSEMQNQGSDDHRGRGSTNNTNTNNPTSVQDCPQDSHHAPASPASRVDVLPGNSPSTGLAHSSTAPSLHGDHPHSDRPHGDRPHSAHLHHRHIGRILRVMGDSYCYSCGVALRQIGDQLAGEYEVRRALSTGDLPNFLKNNR